MSDPKPVSPAPLRPLPRLIFASRWLQLPLYLGLIAAQAVYVVHFIVELVHLIEAAFGSQTALQALITSIGYKTSIPIVTLNETVIMLVVLALIDVVMISNLRNESRADDEHVLLPNWSTRWRSTKWKFVISLLVGRIGGDVERGDKLPQVSLQSGLQVPCGLGSNTVNLVVRSSREGVDSDGALSGSTGGFGRRLIACVIRCDGTARGRDVVGELLLKIWSLRRRRVSALGDLNTSHPFLYRRSV